MDQPLILTLQLDATAQAFYDDLRRRFFPPDRNVIAAHLTLFHQLPDGDSTHETLEQVAKATSRSLLGRPEMRSIGRGVAVFFQAAPVKALHSRLATTFMPHLIPQDRQRLQPHIVVQNKVDPATARATLLQLKDNLLVEPQGIGLTLWRYLGGPWQHLRDFPFHEPAGSQVESEIRY